MTRLNVYAAGAGFWLIREADDGETGLVRGTLPGPAPRLGDDPNGDPATRAAIREIPIAIQGKSFNADGTLFYPANRAFFEGLGDGQDLSTRTPGYRRRHPVPAGADVRYLAGLEPGGLLQHPPVQRQPLAAAGGGPRALSLPPTQCHQLALLEPGAVRGGPDDGKSIRDQEIAFYQIGAEQSLLPKVTKIWTGCKTWLGQGQDAFDINNPPGTGSTAQGCPATTYGSWDADDPDEALLMGPAERADVIVDFTGLPDGTDHG